MIRTRKRINVKRRADAARPKPYPRTAERRYRRLLLKRIRLIGRLVEREVGLVLERNAAEIEALARTDSKETIVKEIVRSLAGVKLAVEGEWSEAATADQLADVAQQIDLFEQGQVGRQWKSVVGVDPFFSSETTKKAITAFERENLRLITNMQNETIAKLEDHLVEAARSGQRVEDFTDIVSERLGVGESRARLIARDQVGSMSGKLAEVRQNELGVMRYEWVTSGDERVRPEHEARDGEIFKWSEPPADGHPGQPIQCRCTASPIIEDLI